MEKTQETEQTSDENLDIYRYPVHIGHKIHQKLYDSIGQRGLKYAGGWDNEDNKIIILHLNDCTISGDLNTPRKEYYITIINEDPNKRNAVRETLDQILGRHLIK